MGQVLRLAEAGSTPWCGKGFFSLSAFGADSGSVCIKTTTLLPCVSVLAQGMVCCAKYMHHTFMPILKQVKLQQQ